MIFVVHGNVTYNITNNITNNYNNNGNNNRETRWIANQQTQTQNTPNIETRNAATGTDRIRIVPPTRTDIRRVHNNIHTLNR